MNVLLILYTVYHNSVLIPTKRFRNRSTGDIAVNCYLVPQIPNLLSSTAQSTPSASSVASQLYSTAQRCQINHRFRNKLPNLEVMAKLRPDRRFSTLLLSTIGGITENGLMVVWDDY